MAWVFGYTVDDAYIVGRYAARIAAGHGYTFVDGPPTDGVTGPPLLLVGLLGVALGVDPVLTAKVVGAACAVLALIAVHRAAAQRAGGSYAAPMAAAFLAVAPSWAEWAVAGLETAPAALAATVLAAAAIGRPRPALAAAAASILVVLRPECTPLALVLVAILVRRCGRRAWPTPAAVVVALVAIGAFRWAMFGTLGPLSAAAKPPDLVNGAVYALRVVVYGTALVAIPFALVAARAHARMRLAGLSVLVHLVAIVLSGGDWMPGARLFVPALPILAWMVGVGARDVFRQLRRSFAGATSRRAVAALIALVLFVPPGTLCALDASNARAAARSRETSGRALAAYLDANASRVALVDVGFLVYVGHFTPIDLAGVTDPSIGRLAGGHVDKPVTGPMLVDRGADAIVLHAATEPGVDGQGRLTALSGHPLERRLAADETVRRAFRVADVREHAPGYWYVTLLRRQDSHVSE